MHLIGYARVSTSDQNLELQLDALKEAGCRRVFEETASGANKARPQLRDALDFLAAWRHARGLEIGSTRPIVQQLIEVIEQLHKRGCGFGRSQKQSTRRLLEAD